MMYICLQKGQIHQVSLWQVCGWEYGNSGDLGELESDVKVKDWVFRDAGIYTFLANYSLDGKLSCGSSETYRFAK